MRLVVLVLLLCRKTFSRAVPPEENPCLPPSLCQHASDDRDYNGNYPAPLCIHMDQEEEDEEEESCQKTQNVNLIRILSVRRVLFSFSFFFFFVSKPPSTQYL